MEKDKVATNMLFFVKMTIYQLKLQLKFDE